MLDQTSAIGLPFADAAALCSSAYLWPAIRKIVTGRQWPNKQAFDLGCGNGATCGFLNGMGFAVTGIDVSERGVAVARSAVPQARFFVGSGYDNLVATYGRFDLVVCLEVIEHCFDPHAMARTFVDLIAPGGIGILSTPYHGYMKNLAIALVGRMDRHFCALDHGGHIKFFSVATLGSLLRSSGATEVKFVRVGRIPVFAKSVIAIVSSLSPP